MIKQIDKISRKYVMIPVVIIGIVLILIGTLLSSYVLKETIPSITFSSKKLDYNKKEPGSINITKSAEWIGKGKARITFDLDTILDVNDQDLDLFFVLDISSSMEDEKLEQLKESVKETSNSLLSNRNNKVGLITFGREATILSELTNDQAYIDSIIESIWTESIENNNRNDTSYYQAFLKIGDILEKYKKEENRSFTVLFLTDGIPNRDVPNQKGEYTYLKPRYPYLNFQGIQYEIEDDKGEIITEIIDQLREISNRQFLATKEDLTEVLLEASIEANPYERLEITDYIEGEYFNLKGETDIQATYGTTKLEREEGVQKVIWNLNGLNSGSKETLTIDIELKEEYQEMIELFPTNQKESVHYKIEDIEEAIEETKTPIYQDIIK